MTEEIWTDFDPNLDIPIGLKNVKIVAKPDVENSPSADTVADIQDGDLDSEEEFEADDTDETLAAPQSFEVISQTIRTSQDGSQVVDIVVDVEEVAGALDYEVRVTPV